MAVQRLKDVLAGFKHNITTSIREGRINSGHQLELAIDDAAQAVRQAGGSESHIKELASYAYDRMEILQPPNIAPDAIQNIVSEGRALRGIRVAQQPSASQPPSPINLGPNMDWNEMDPIAGKAGPPKPPKPPTPPAALGGVGGIPPEPNFIAKESQTDTGSTNTSDNFMGAPVGPTALDREVTDSLAPPSPEAPLTPPSPVSASGPDSPPLISVGNPFSDVKAAAQRQIEAAKIWRDNPPRTNPMGMYSAAGFGAVGPIYPDAQKSVQDSKALDPLPDIKTQITNNPLVVANAGFGGYFSEAADILGRVGENAAGVGLGIGVADTLGSIKTEIQGTPGSIAQFMPAAGVGGGGSADLGALPNLIQALQKMAGLRMRI